MMSGRKQLTSAHYRAFRVKHFAVFRVRVGVIYALNLNIEYLGPLYEFEVTAN